MERDAFVRLETAMVDSSISKKVRQITTSSNSSNAHFNSQTLKSNETSKMPVVFYIDPAIAEDPTMENIETITLSYTFFKYIDDK